MAVVVPVAVPVDVDVPEDVEVTDAVDVDVTDTVLVGVTLAVPELDGVLDGDAPGLKLDVGVTDTDTDARPGGHQRRHEDAGLAVPRVARCGPPVCCPRPRTASPQ